MKSPVAYLGIGVLLLLFIDWVDYLSGQELHFFVFYFVPVAFVSWYTNQTMAITFTIVAAIAWLTVNYLEGAFTHTGSIAIGMRQYGSALS
jgi:hypothetical protein